MADNQISKYEPEQNQPVVPWTKVGKLEPKKDCKLCNSKWKDEAETLFDRTNSITKVYKFLTEDRQEDISYNACRNHLKFHYEAHSSKYLMREYANEVEEWMDMQQNQKQGMVRAMAQLERMSQKIQAESEGLPLAQYIKHAESAAKLLALLLSYRSKIEELDKDENGVTLVLNQIKLVMKDELEHYQSPETRKFVKSVIAKMKGTVGHIDAGEEA